MHAIRLYGAEDARLDDVSEPQLRPGTVKVKVAWAGICGTDLMLYRDAPIPLDYVHPIMGEFGAKTLGHEFAGTVTEIAAEVSGIEVGDLVAVQPNIADGTCPACFRGQANLCKNGAFIGVHGWGGGFSEYVVVPADHAFVLPDGIGLEVGALVESLSVAWHAVKKSGAGSGSTALVVGAGPIGLGLVLCLKAIGVTRVIVSEVSSSRRELARTFGAQVVDPCDVEVDAYVRSVSDGGVDASFDASGVGTPTLHSALNALRAGGTCVVVAQFHGEVPIDPNLLMNSERCLVGSLAYTAEDFSEVISAIADGRICPAPMITSKIRLSEVVVRGIEHLLGDGRSTEVKILVSPES